MSQVGAVSGTIYDVFTIAVSISRLVPKLYCRTLSEVEPITNIVFQVQLNHIPNGVVSCHHTENCLSKDCVVMSQAVPILSCNTESLAYGVTPVLIRIYIFVPSGLKNTPSADVV